MNRHILVLEIYLAIVLYARGMNLKTRKAIEWYQMKSKL